MYLGTSIKQVLGPRVTYIDSKTQISILITNVKKSIVPYLITSVGHRADPSFLAVGPQVPLFVNLMVGCHYFPPGPRLLVITSKLVI